MSWILKNKFSVVLILIALLLCGAALFFGLKAGSRYEDAKQNFAQSAAQVARFERAGIYPNQTNLDAKTKALADFEEGITSLKETFAKYQSEPREPIAPQDFSNLLIERRDAMLTSLQDAKIAYPAAFYFGFEAYSASLAPRGATDVLSHQLQITESVVADLVAARPTEILNFRRYGQPEEKGETYSAADGDVARPHAFEITFKGNEASIRRFLTRLTSLDQRYAIVRAVRILNESTAAPKPSNSLFAQPAVAVEGFGANPFSGNVFDAFADVPGAEESPELDAEDAVGIDEVAAPSRTASDADGDRILGQVAGSEEIRICVRFDVMEVLKPKENSQPR